MEERTFEQAVKSVEGITLEQIWAILQEDRRKWEADEERRAAEEKRRAAEEKRRAAEEKRRAAEQKKLDEKRAAEMAEFKRNLEKAVGHLGNSMGDLTEALFSGAFFTQFEALGYEFSRQSPNMKFYDNKRCVAEADYWLEDGDYVMAVEVKTKPTNADVDEHVERLGIIKNHLNKRNKGCILIGAIAGGVINESTIKYAQKQGFYVMVQSGESVKVIDLPEGFKVREW